MELKAEERASTLVGQNSTQKPQPLHRSTVIVTLPFAIVDFCRRNWNVLAHRLPNLVRRPTGRERSFDDGRLAIPGRSRCDATVQTPAETFSTMYFTRQSSSAVTMSLTPGRGRCAGRSGESECPRKYPAGEGIEEFIDPAMGHRVRANRIGHIRIRSRDTQRAAGDSRRRYGS